ncbi:hypothetical protein CCR95_01090 [Thiocystis minor]|nr:hypothetical protein [Thiocystis minor]
MTSILFILSIRSEHRDELFRNESFAAQIPRRGLLVVVVVVVVVIEYSPCRDHDHDNDNDNDNDNDLRRSWDFRTVALV